MKDVSSKDHPLLLQISARNRFEMKKKSPFHSFCKENSKKVHGVLKPGLYYLSNI